MKTSRAAVASAAFFVAAPGTVVGLIPWLITRWEIADSTPTWQAAVGAALIVVGLIPPAHAFVQFVKAGGTPIPIAPTQRLVVTGFNRYVRNPMYVGLIVAILGQALLFSSVGLVVYAAIVWTITASFVRWYEEPTLVHEYGDEYEDYRHNVRAWLPRLRPWTPVMPRGSGSSYTYDSDRAYPAD
jgi:protein-S-isoprenylcysteine O-methyltransferase Ste14